MKENKNQTAQPSKRDIEPGSPHYNPGNTATPQQEVQDEDVKAEREHEKNQPKQETDEEDRKVVNEQEQDQVVNDDGHSEKPAEQPKEKKKAPAKMSETVNEQDRS